MQIFSTLLAVVQAWSVVGHHRMCLETIPQGVHTILKETLFIDPLKKSKRKTGQ